MTQLIICDVCGKQAKAGGTAEWTTVVYDDPTTPWPLRRFKDVCPDCKRKQEAGQ